jgi:hypothetical protein
VCAQARILLLVLIRRHWQMHGPYLRELFPATGALEAQLVTQVDQLDREGDGARKAMSLHGLLKLLIGAYRVPPMQDAMHSSHAAARRHACVCHAHLYGWLHVHLQVTSLTAWSPSCLLTSWPHPSPLTLRIHSPG